MKRNDKASPNPRRWSLFDRPRSQSTAACLAGLLAASFLAPAGCTTGSGELEAKAAANRQQQRQVAKSNALFESVTARLRDLPAEISLELRPPAVVLDSTSSGNGQDVMAIGRPAPGANPPVITRLTVPAGNGNFKSAGIKGGDKVRCYLLPDNQFIDRLRETGEQDMNVLSHVPVEAVVSQVQDSNTLLIDGGLRLPPRAARTLAENIPPRTLETFRQAGLPDNVVQQVIAGFGAAGVTDTDGVPLPDFMITALPGVAWPFKIEVWRTLDDRMIEINNALSRYAARSGPPPAALAWEPSPDAPALAGIVDRLNQWLRSRTRPDDWAPAALTETLPKGLAQSKTLAPYFDPGTLAAAAYSDHDGRLLQEAIWCRDVARWACGERFEPVERATQMFDWCVRNVTLSDDPRVGANRPWQTMLYGRGTAAQRAWVFAMLCRQQRLPMVVLRVDAPSDADRPWLWCALIDQGQLYLFDPQLGLPLTSAGGEKVATLAEVAADDALLRALDLEGSPYPVTAEAAAKAEAFAVADPFALSWRAEELQRQFTADDALTLVADADGVAKQAVAAGVSGGVRLWPAPLELLRRRLTLGPATRKAVAVEFRPYAWRPHLWKARVLHMRGLLETAEDARKKGDALYDPINDHRAAGRLYMDRSVRPDETTLARVVAEKQRVYRHAKADATYWLGVLQYDQGSYASSGEWLRRAAEEGKKAVGGRSRRADGIAYNRARALEAAGDLAAAAELLEASDSPQRHGDRLRAQQLRRAAAE
ncbi:MAG: hypothetical protein AAGB00_03675 [Planctomycetota bacterium]